MRSSRAALAVFGLAAVIAASPAVASTQAPPPPPTTKTGTQLAAEPVEITKSVVIRYYTSGPEVYENSAHANTAGVTDVYENAGGSTEIIRPVQPGERVSYVSAALDSDVAKQRLFCGTSGGLSVTQVACYRATDGAKVLPSPGPYVNLWVTWHIQLPAQP